MRISDFTDEKGIEVAARLLSPVCSIVSDSRNISAKGKSGIEFFGEMLRNSPKETMQMVAILNEQDPEQYHCNGATALQSVMELAADPDLMALFGLRRQTPASSGPAQANTEARETPGSSADT